MKSLNKRDRGRAKNFNGNNVPMTRIRRFQAVTGTSWRRPTITSAMIRSRHIAVSRVGRGGDKHIDILEHLKYVTALKKNGGI
jgi:hypothetical protein